MQKTQESLDEAFEFPLTPRDRITDRAITAPRQVTVVAPNDLLQFSDFVTCSEVVA